MNTNGLAKQYDKLTPRERFPLIVAALDRDDKAEYERLSQSAPRTHYGVSHHWPVAFSFHFLAILHFIALLDLAGQYSAAFGRVGRKWKKGDKNLESDWRDALTLGHIFKTYLSGWHKFCAESKLDPEIVWKLLPGFVTVKRVERACGPDPDTGFPGPGFWEDEVARYLVETSAEDPEAEVDEETLKKFRPVTADTVGDNLRIGWEKLIKVFGG